MWAEGIADCDFTLLEIIDSFKEHNIEIPESLLKGFINEIQKKKNIKYEKQLNNAGNTR